MNSKLTAYALNELPPDERAALEAQMENDPALRQQAEEMKAFCALLIHEIGQETTDALTSDQRQNVIQAFHAKPADSTPGRIIRPLWRHPVFLSTTALAACVAIMLVRHFNTVPLDENQIGGKSLAINNTNTYTGGTISGDVLSTDSAGKKPPVTKLQSQALNLNKSVTKDETRTRALTAAPLRMSGGSTQASRMDNSAIALHEAHPADPMQDAPVDRVDKAKVAMNDLALSPGTNVSGTAIKTPESRAAAAHQVGAVALLPAPSPTPMPRITSSMDLDATPALRITGGATVIAGKDNSAEREETLRRYQTEALRQRLEEAKRRVDSYNTLSRTPSASTATYRPIIENPFTFVAQEPLSTFSTDVDTASYANVRRFLNTNQRPPADAVRLEELINYFPYNYEAPKDDKPFAVHVDMAEAPWQPLHRLARIALKAREVKREARNAANFVFLIDISGSMMPPERLPLIKQSLRLLVEQLREDDRVAIVTYAGECGVALESTAGSQKERIMQVVDGLNAHGSTNGASGIRLAYEQAALNFNKERINRVILCTDGDFNVGVSSVQELEKLIAEKAKGGVFLSVLGVGTDNLHDHTMQTLADRGNGNYHYLDSLGEARKVLVEQMTGTLVTVAKDVKIQVEFNPSQVAAYRLIGYEKRLLAKEDFNDDKKDASEIGAGHTVTALYEIVPANVKYPDGKPLVDDLKYNKPAAAPEKAATATAETMTVKLRYKAPDGDKSTLMEVPVTDTGKKLSESNKDFQFAVGVAGFGMLLRDSQQRGELTWDTVRDLARRGKGDDELGYRGEFLQLIEKARGICGQ